MKLQDLEKVLIEAFVRLDSRKLIDISATANYSYNDKEEFIEELQSLFTSIKSRGIEALVVKPSKCKYCYPTSKSYSFHDSKTDEFIIRYVIHQESENEFRIEECKNQPIFSTADGMPFLIVLY